MKIYKHIPGGNVSADTHMRYGLLAKFRVFLPDRPGSLAGFASAIATAGGNIAFFHYDRSADSSRVVVEVQLADEAGVEALTAALRAGAYGLEIPAAGADEVQITSVENVLEIKVRLENRPGTLAAFARLLAEHDANVIYMLYDEDIDPESADIAMAAKDTAEITALLQAMNERGYYYRVLYRGADEQEAAHVIGLKMVEKFFLRLKKLLPASTVDEVRSLVSSSRDLYQDLVQFYREAGNNLEAGDVFEQVLTFASRSRSWTGDRFTARKMGPLALSGVKLYGFRLPTSENIYLLDDGDELTMIDAGHGIYYEDVKRYLRSQDLDPGKVRRILVTHPDTDHAGMSGYFEQEFGSVVMMHSGSADVIANMNRAHGAAGPLANLNKYYTRLSSRFTECRFPEHPRYFDTADRRTSGQFKIIDELMIGPLRFDVLESRGGHTPGLVFFLEREHGLLFTSDFLLNVPSLSTEEKEHLGIYRYLLTNPNKDSRVYRDETEALKELARNMDRNLRSKGGKFLIFPGHGKYYGVEEM
jgi:glyoxylase-like metal-dependent hydrolase (beta-lactamase superfamily II)/glycine cleavage system regulatory protein